VMERSTALRDRARAASSRLTDVAWQQENRAGN
jgi:hypothetical protein